MQAFDFLSVRSLDELSAVLATKNPSIRLLSGGTDLLLQLREGRARAQQVIEIKHIPELLEIKWDPFQGLRLGAAAACRQICLDPQVQAHYPGLVDAFSLIGGVQIQNQASVGGNLCNASPAADSIPALIVHRAVCQIVSQQGVRRVPVEDFCRAPGKTILEPGEFLAWLDIPPSPLHFGAHYLRFIPRNEMDIAVAGAAASVTLDAEGKHFLSARLALSAVAPIPLDVLDAAEFLIGKPVTPEVIAQAAQLARAAARPISDLRGSADQRRQLCEVLSRRAFEKAVWRARVEA